MVGKKAVSNDNISQEMIIFFRKPMTGKLIKKLITVYSNLVFFLSFHDDSNYKGMRTVIDRVIMKNVY